MELNFEQFTQQFDSTLEPIICHSAERQVGKLYPNRVSCAWKSPLQPHSEIKKADGPLIVGVRPHAIDTEILRATASCAGAQKVGTYIIPRKDALPSVYLLAREPRELCGNYGWLQLVEGLLFEHVNDDPQGFPCTLICEEDDLPIIAQARVGVENLSRPVARVPSSIEYRDALMNADCIIEEGSTLLVSYADEREPQEFELFHLTQ